MEPFALLPPRLRGRGLRALVLGIQTSVAWHSRTGTAGVGAGSRSGFETCSEECKSRYILEP